MVREEKIAKKLELKTLKMTSKAKQDQDDHHHGIHPSYKRKQDAMDFFLLTISTFNLKEQQNGSSGKERRLNSSDKRFSRVRFLRTT